jgi:archaellum component FlaC
MGILHRLKLAVCGNGVQNAHLVQIEARLADIDGRINHWVTLMDALNHRLGDIQDKLADAAADVEMVAALAMSMERTVGMAGRQPPPGPAESATENSSAI